MYSHTGGIYKLCVDFNGKYFNDQLWGFKVVGGGGSYWTRYSLPEEKGGQSGEFHEPVFRLLNFLVNSCNMTFFCNMIWLFVELIDLNSQVTVHGVWILDQKWHPQTYVTWFSVDYSYYTYYDTLKKKLNSFLENTTDT